MFCFLLFILNQLNQFLSNSLCKCEQWNDIVSITNFLYSSSKLWSNLQYKHFFSAVWQQIQFVDVTALVLLYKLHINCSLIEVINNNCFQAQLCIHSCSLHRNGQWHPFLFFAWKSLQGKSTLTKVATQTISGGKKTIEMSDATFGGKMKAFTKARKHKTWKCKCILEILLSHGLTFCVQHLRCATSKLYVLKHNYLNMPVCSGSWH